MQRMKVAVAAGLMAVALTACRETARQTANDWDATQELMVGDDLSNSKVAALVEDGQGFIWIGTFHGLNRFDGQEYHQYFCTDDSTGLPDNQIKALLCDSKQRLWVGTVNGICRYTDQDRFLRIPMKTDNRYVRQLLEDGDGRIFARNANGMLRFDEKMGAFVPADGSQPRLRKATTEEYPLPDSVDTAQSHVSTWLRDSRGNLWTGTDNRGLTVKYADEERFNSDRELNRAVGQSSVTDVAVDRTGQLWIASQDKGILMRDTTGHTRHIEISGRTGNNGQEDAAVHLLADADGFLWVATGAEVLKCRYAGGRLSPVARFDIKKTMCMVQAQDKTVWISASDTYIYCVRLGSDKVDRKQLSSPNSFTPSVATLADGSILVSACNRKMVSLNPATMKASELVIPETDWKACVRRSVFIPVDVCQDSRGSVWIGTVSNGLMRMDRKTCRMEHIGGLSCSDISSIEEDAQGNVWVSTLKGLNRYDPKTGKVTMFYKFDGMGGDEFNDRASCRLPDGTLVFGGLHGLTYFNPADIHTRQDIPLYFQDLRVHGQLVRPNERAAIAKSLVHCPEINLRHDQNSFSISFCALDYSKYPRVHYWYKLDGVDKDWVDAGTARTVSYTNLPAGHYTFRVKTGSNDSASTQQEKAIKVTVMPAPWNSPWAWALYLILTGLLASYLYDNRMRTVAARQAAKEAEREKERELRTNQMNMSFFANIAHEFRTPLTMIAGPVGQLLGSKNIGSEEKSLLGVAQRSIQRMFKLVNQLMDFNKLENDTLRLHVEPTDVAKAVNDICDTFAFNVKEKGLTLTRHGLEEPLTAWTDGDKLEKIVSNLLSNALKFTPTGGKIDVSLDAADGQVMLAVSDTGQGIPKDQLEHIFKRYYQLDNQTKGIINWGTGIGLYFSRRLAVLHHGTLTAGNRATGIGAVFTLTYPMQEQDYTEEERRPLEDGNGEYQSAETYVHPIEQADETMDKKTDADDKRPTVLVVDDDTEIVHYMRILFARDYRLVTCLNAETALEQMREEGPDIVLSDVSMPGMDGYELCREIKQDIQLCHIPVILVTAKVTVDNQVEGLNVGADAYVTKPFEPTVLSALIQSQLKNRERIRSILTNSTAIKEDAADNVLSEQDKRFVDELYKLMEEELANSELDVTKMTKMLYISRTKLYYKIKGLTGETPANFFRTYKLNRAAELVKEGKYTISEIADKCGFSSQSHFSIVFKKQFGVAPSQYKA